MNFSSTCITTTAIIFILTCVTSTSLAFSPAPTTIKSANNSLSKNKVTTQLNYIREVDTNKIKDCLSIDDDADDFIDPMEEVFDNMQHPMELMLLSRACIPYVMM
jgi:hypothetical protein